MGFEEFLPVNEKESENIERSQDKILIDEDSKKIGQNQVYDVITSKKHDWYDIIYELIYSDQLDPWDIDLVVLTKKYFEKILEIEETDFYISSKVLLAAALLLRIKSEMLLNKHIKSIDEILFGKNEGQKNVFERILIEEDELPLLIPKTPIPRLKKVTLQELMNALNKAINTESRRIKKEIEARRAKFISKVDFPKAKRVDLKDRIRKFYARILSFIKKKAISEDKHMNKVSYSNLVGREREERLASFLPLLHLSDTKKLWLEQENHLEEIWIYLYEYFDRNRDEFFEKLQKDAEEIKEESESEIKNKVQEKITEKIAEEKTEEKMDKITGFDEGLM